MVKCRLLTSPGKDCVPGGVKKPTKLWNLAAESIQGLRAVRVGAAGPIELTAVTTQNDILRVSRKGRPRGLHDSSEWQGRQDTPQVDLHQLTAEPDKDSAAGLPGQRAFTREAQRGVKVERRRHKSADGSCGSMTGPFVNGAPQGVKVER